MGHNVWSGIHIRLGPEIMAEHKRVDGLIVWDMLCGTDMRPCPKLLANPERATVLPDGTKLPPPCLYLFPRTIADHRNNPYPRPWSLGEVRLLDAIARVFKCVRDDLVEVRFKAGHNGAEVTRATHLVRDGVEVRCSRESPVKSARG